MSKHTARISWRRESAEFIDLRYSRVHRWSFDGGASVEASASPDNVPEPYSVPEAVDPEEALVAAASSCHMLWFLSRAAKAGLIVDSYVDDASGIIEENPEGRRAFSRISLRPEITFSGASPSAEDLKALHEAAHDNCFIANSLRCEVVVES